MSPSNSFAKKLTRLLVDLAIEIVLVVAIFYLLSLFVSTLSSNTLLMVSVFASVLLYRVVILPYAIKMRAMKDK